MKLSDFDFELPEELIAQHPTEKRDNSRLLVLHKNTGAIEHKHFYDIIDYLKPGDVLVRNNSKVIPARLYGTKKDTGARVDPEDRRRYLRMSLWQCQGDQDRNRH